jgi:hypothetical protein
MEIDEKTFKLNKESKYKSLNDLKMLPKDKLAGGGSTRNPLKLEEDGKLILAGTAAPKPVGTHSVTQSSLSLVNPQRLIA